MSTKFYIGLKTGTALNTIKSLAFGYTNVLVIQVYVNVRKIGNISTKDKHPKDQAITR